MRAVIVAFMSVFISPVILDMVRVETRPTSAELSMQAPAAGPDSTDGGAQHVKSRANLPIALSRLHGCSLQRSPAFSTWAHTVAAHCKGAEIDDGATCISLAGSPVR